ncbi:hypothetical protein MPTK1_8g12450 [Marchantia polymorpha subsp. ruderalis]|uniref:Uncharacterized protein n=1 Tax=Marchantia polymorpha TaxID=3197 RepID=A0A2R6WJS9_MARPO|nr:hypothetical protein MARPO_0083s0075 [Marchantia polymorpha]BBN19650.1 hypothetical protein Mp_8g12450 [Marchantia polymorpha subsp. ruderalis]|eukprot:PTQ34117.1 hypothetical protein MARPO_0083s0075 [Marchantia polymorpha]
MESTSEKTSICGRSPSLHFFAPLSVFLKDFITPRKKNIYQRTCQREHIIPKLPVVSTSLTTNIVFSLSW